jgi:hypothetical protein
VVVQRPVDTPKEATPTPPPAPKPATVADISPIVQDLARAIESREISSLRRVYPGITTFQQRNFETFFQLAQKIDVTFRIENFEGTTSTADARLVGRYDFTNADGRQDTKPAIFQVTFQRDGNSWRMVSMR